MNSELITKFYSAFQKRDWLTMNNCYHPDATFYDPAFRHLDSADLKSMWHMLCMNAKDFELTFSNVKTDGNSGSAEWHASYSFSKTGRKVHNRIKAAFIFQDGLIFDHRDDFDLWKWSRMALGIPGILVGWSGSMHDKIHENARKSLEKFKSATSS